MTKINKFIVSLAIAVAIMLCPTHTVFASGEEIWNNDVASYDYFFIFEDTNLTPVKTIGYTGTLVIWGDFNKYDDGESGVRLTLQVRDADTGQILEQAQAVNYDIQEPTMFFLTCPVTYGQRIQLFFDASSVNNPPGFYRWAAVEYHVYFSGS